MGGSVVEETEQAINSSQFHVSHELPICDSFFKFSQFMFPRSTKMVDEIIPK